MPETVWFTSDTHFGHRGLVEKGYRLGFSSVEQMDDTLIRRWNERVGRNDRVYHLGDFSFHTRSRTAEIVEALHGQLHVVRGNHDGVLDSVHKARPKLFASYERYKEIKVEGQRICLFHFPMVTWHQVHHGSWHLHGHCHNNLADAGLPRLDVGVDARDFAPVSFEEIVQLMEARTFQVVDHHGAME